MNRKLFLKKIKSIIFVAAVFFVSLIVGFFLGNPLKKELLSGATRLPMLLFSPNIELNELYSLTFSESYLSRISGYYGLSSMKVLDLDFYKKRLNYEDSIVVKRVLLFGLSENFEEKIVYDFFEEYYRSANELEKGMVLDILKVKDIKIYNRFLKL